MLTPRRLAVLGLASVRPLRALFTRFAPPYRRVASSAVDGDSVDEIYRQDQWWSMRSFADAGRYGVLVEWIRRLAPEGPVLDIGAGDGLLVHALAGSPVDYLGVDFAAATMARMQAELGGPRRRFVYGDATNYIPERQYPIILLNDMLYYLDEPVRHAQRLAGYLEPGGTLIVTMDLEGGEQIKILHELHRAFSALEQCFFVSDRARSFVQVALKQRTD